MARNRVIGSNQGLPWRLPEDMRFFMMTTTGKPVIMGRKTFESMKAPLPRRLNIVVTREAGYVREGVQVAGSFEAALAFARTYCEEMHCNEIIVAGGSEIYRLALPHAGRLYVTRIAADIEGDTHFPEMDWSGWQQCWKRDYLQLPAHDYDFSIAQWQVRR